MRVIFGSLALLALAAPADAALVNLGAGSFNPSAPSVTFDAPLGTQNPSFTLDAGALGSVEVSFGGTLVGQTVTNGFPVSLDNNVPTGPVGIDPNGPSVFITNDGSNPTSPVLSGTPTFNGPISFTFDRNVTGVLLDGGFFNNVASMSIEAYARDGSVLGRVSNTITGIETFGLADSNGQAVIAAVSFFITGNEPGGFAIDNVTFGGADVIDDPQVVPLPGAAVLLASGLGVLGFMRRRRA